MLPHGLEVNHVFGQQQGLVHSISHIPNCSLLEVSDRGVTRESNSIQLHVWGLGWGCSSVVSPLLSFIG